jgi:hypothetical protein
MAAFPGNTVAFDSLRSGGNDERMRRAIYVVRQTLAGLPESMEVRRLLDLSQRLQDQIERFDRAVPLPAVREQVMRAILSIHLEALRLRAQRAAPNDFG